MDDRAMTTVQINPEEIGKQIHPVMALIASTWTNFAAGKQASQKKQIIISWESALADIPVDLQLEAIKKKAREGQVWPPSSPNEVRSWCNQIQTPMNGTDALWYRTAIEEGLLDPDFCRRQIAGYEAAKADGRVYYAGWD